MGLQRDMIIGKWDSGKLSHQTVIISYFSKITCSERVCLVCRTFFVELFVTEEKQLVLSVKGPTPNLREYSCKEFFAIHASMEQLIDIAKTTINAHGEYKYYTNNCRNFAARLVCSIMKDAPVIQLGSLKPQLMMRYMARYSSDDSTNIADSKDAEDKKEELAWRTRKAIAMATQDNDVSAKLQVDTITITQVLREFSFDT